MRVLKDVSSGRATAGPPSPATVAALEKCPEAARRMGVSLSQFYRIAQRDSLRIVKTSIRASAVVSGDVDAWIAGKIARAGPVQTSAHGGGHE